MVKMERTGMEDRKKEILYVAVIFLQKLITAAADVLWLVLLAELIGEVLPGDGAVGDMEKSAQYVLGLILLSAWKRMGYSFGRSLTLKLQNMVRFRMNCRMVEKTAKIPYRLLEDYTFCELRQALKESINGNTNKSFVWFAVQKSGNFMLFCVRILGVSLLLAWASIPLGLLFLLLEICHCLMTALGIEQEASFMGAWKSSPEKKYMEELALGQTEAGERSLFSYAGYIGEKCDREAVNVRRAAFFQSLEYRKTELANQLLILITYVPAEIALAALMAEGRISPGYFIALSIGVCGLIQKNEEGDALRYLQREKVFIKQWERFMNLPETEENGDLNGEKGGERNGEKDRKKGRVKGKAVDGDKGVKQRAGNDYMIQEFETLEFRKVSFRYPRTGRYVLHDLNFKLTKGGYYAFVGANGSGKTTIVKLLSGLYDNYEGAIRLNGIELREIPFCERRRIFAILFQDAARYDDTVVQNIMPRAETAYGTDCHLSVDCHEYGHIYHKGQSNLRWTAIRPMPVLNKAAISCTQLARGMAEELVREWETGGGGRFPQGADTFLGSMEENGVMLSAGEWQQLLIARELAQPAQIRVMDEPMAALDIFRQSRIYEQCTENAGNGTILLFSHHMAAVRKAKRIFVLRDGTVAEEGSHDRLMDEKGLYAKMYETQREARRAEE